MIINTQLIQSFNPCEARFNNYLNFYSNFEGDFDSFLDLSEITYSDKVWVAKKVLNKNQLVHWAILCAESVLPIFEKQYPNETAVRDLLNLLKSIPDYSNAVEADAAVYAAADAAAYTAADARKNQQDLNLQFLKMAASL